MALLEVECASSDTVAAVLCVFNLVRAVVNIEFVPVFLSFIPPCFDRAWRVGARATSDEHDVVPVKRCLSARIIFVWTKVGVDVASSWFVLIKLSNPAVETLLWSRSV